ncbi:uncharacterized protein LOC107413517 isoform X3 [Ziziphus jujuba]|uniref:Uncharacterized protein LOC107413517 isoform X3 n=1 Tax=Ziziphus jujuba TaxID=326968 RepID=A0ABM4AFA1_ZIZJJ|nr:uncharacterized protein LOC107413517 isoform X3 [Ziziphus jujuba]
MSSSFSPSWGPSTGGSSRFQLGGVGGVSRLRSSSLKKPPEPLRRAVADCLSSSAANSHHGNPSSAVLLTEASRTLRDYLANPPTMDLAYNVILEHTIAERERSPAVVARCVALLKRYLLRYKPSEETLLLIDRFCVSTIAECDTSPNRRLSPYSRPVLQQSGASTASKNISPLPVSSFASGALVKSLNYVRSLVFQHIPKRLFQPAAFAGNPSTSRQALPTLSSLLSRSFNSQLSPAQNAEPSDNKDITVLSLSNSSNIEKVDGTDDFEYIPLDVLKWRWLGECQSPFLPESDRYMNPQDMRKHNFIEVGAAALLVGDIEAKMNGQLWKYFGTADMPFLDQLLQPSPVTTITDSAFARPHLRAITASKRTRAGPHQIWHDSPVSTFRPRAKPLFQYRHYSEQQPLRLNPAEVCEVIAAVCSDEMLSPNANAMTVSSRLNNNSGKPSMDVAVSVLIKLIIDMYVLDAVIAAPLTLSMLQEMLSSPKMACRARAFDLILNLGVHAQLLEPMVTDNASTIEEDFSQEPYFDNEAELATPGKGKMDSVKMGTSSAISGFESWILNILYEILLLLVQIEEKEELVWASALSCLLYFVCDRGKIRRNQLNDLDIRVIKVLIEISRKNSWAEVVHCKLVSMLANMFYRVPEGNMDAVSSSPIFLVEQVDLIGGIEFIFLEYTLANSREERRSLYLVLFDYVLHQINETCICTGVMEYSEDEIQPLAGLLTLADAPEAFYISVKLGIEGIGEILRRSISTALSRYPNSERLNTLLESVTEKFDAIISSFTHLDKEFSHMLQMTKSYKVLESVEGSGLRNGIDMEAKLAWATLHSLLHSDRISYRQNGYTWLGDLLIAEISEEKNGSIWSNIKNLQQKIALAGVQDASSASDVPLSISLMCGLLKSRNYIIRWGFLFVLERLLMRCKFLLDEYDMQHSNGGDVGHVEKGSRLEKANAVIDIMSSALSLVFQINETDRYNILKMCEILLSQLGFRVPPNAMSFGDDIHLNRASSFIDDSKKFGASDCVPQQENSPSDVCIGEADGRSNLSSNNPLDHETASMAALLLRATDNIALGVAVGSNGRGNLPGASSDIRSTLLLLLIGKCSADSAAFLEVGGEEFFRHLCFGRELLDDPDSRVAYYSSAFLLKRMMTGKPEKYQHMLQSLVVRAQQSNNEKLLENPYLQMRGILQLANDLGTGL